MLGHNKLSLVVVFVLVGSHIRTFHEPHHVGVLFNGARFTEVRELRAVAALFLDLTAKLGKRNDRDVQFLRQNLEAARNGANGHGAVFFATRLH